MIRLQQIQASLKVLLYLFVVTSFLACHKKGDTPDDDEQAHISIDVDWSELDQVPTGMTVYFYPENGRPPYTYITNDVHHIERSLPEMNYEILLFNQTIEEFSSIGFRGMDNINTAEIFAPEEEGNTQSLIEKLYNGFGRAYSKSGLIQPRCIAAGRGKASRPTRSYTDSKVIKPEVKVGQLTATVHVKGIKNVKKVNGALTGLASGTHLGIDKLNDTSLTQEIEDWTISESGNTETISTTFGTFGLSPSLDYSGTKSRADGRFIDPSPEDDQKNILYLNFLLQDNTYISYRFDVTNNIKDYSTEAAVELVLNVGTDVEQFVTIPETGIPYGDVPVSVQPWGTEEKDHNITL